MDWVNVYVFAGWGKVDGRRFLLLSALRGREIQLPSLMLWKDGKGMEGEGVGGGGERLKRNL